MSWQLNTIVRAIHRHEREAARRARLAAERLERLQKVRQRAEDLAEAAVAQFESHLAVLTSLHRECTDPVDWNALLVHPLPPMPSAPPPVDRSLSQEARAALESHSRSLAGRLFGSTRRLELEQALADAEEFENATAAKLQAEHQAQLAEHARAVADTLETQELAGRVLAGDITAQAVAVQVTKCLDEILNLLGQSRVDLTVERHYAMVEMRAEPDACVPTEQYSLTAEGMLSIEKFDPTRRMEIYEDFVCGAALRVARELMAVIPTPQVLVHVASMQLIPATGHVVPIVILSVIVPREVTTRVDWTRVDASELVATLRHNMKRKRGVGFESVEKLPLPESA